MVSAPDNASKNIIVDDMTIFDRAKDRVPLFLRANFVMSVAAFMILLLIVGTILIFKITPKVNKTTKEFKENNKSRKVNKQKV